MDRRHNPNHRTGFYEAYSTAAASYAIEDLICRRSERLRPLQFKREEGEDLGFTRPWQWRLP